jgi:tRNA pseudouridine38-40 synthase
MSDPTIPNPPVQRWKLTLAYDGTDFHGWQIQPGKCTIQGEIQSALGRITGETPLPQGSGRTDSGVHALAQVASFDLRAPIPAENLHRALNRTLPASIRVLGAETMPSTFHARHSAIAKTYEYRIWIEGSEDVDICPPFLARYVYTCPWRLDRRALEQAAACFVGEHDFKSFAATDPDLSTRTEEKLATSANSGEKAFSTVRRVAFSAWEDRKTNFGDLLVYRVRGNGFLHHMVRNLVGTMIDAGRGYLSVEDIPRILAAGARCEAGPTAPARGLFLHSVDYAELRSSSKSQ